MKYDIAISGIFTLVYAVYSKFTNGKLQAEVGGEYLRASVISFIHYVWSYIVAPYNMAISYIRWQLHIRRVAPRPLCNLYAFAVQSVQPDINISSDQYNVYYKICETNQVATGGDYGYYVSFLKTGTVTFMSDYSDYIVEVHVFDNYICDIIHVATRSRYDYHGYKGLIYDNRHIEATSAHMQSTGEYTCCSGFYAVHEQTRGGNVEDTKEIKYRGGGFCEPAYKEDVETVFTAEPEARVCYRWADIAGKECDSNAKNEINIPTTYVKLIKAD